MNNQEENDIIQKTEQEIKKIFVSNGLSEDLYDELKSKGYIVNEICDEEYEDYSSGLPEGAIGYITCDSFSGKKKSRKVQNLGINVKATIACAISGASIPGLIASKNTFSTICALVSFVLNAERAITLELDNEHVKVYIALWNRFDKKMSINLLEGYEGTNEYLSRYGEDEISYDKFIAALNYLEKARMLDFINNEIYLKEKVRSKVALK